MTIDENLNACKEGAPPVSPPTMQKEDLTWLEQVGLFLAFTPIMVFLPMFLLHVVRCILADAPPENDDLWAWIVLGLLAWTMISGMVVGISQQCRQNKGGYVAGRSQEEDSKSALEAGDTDVEKGTASKPDAESSEDLGTLFVLAGLLTVVCVGLSLILTVALVIISFITAVKKL